MTRRPPKDDPYGTPPMFDLPEGDDGDEGDRPLVRKAVRSVRQGKCPCCLVPTMGLIRVGQHLVWRHHLYTTWSGARMPCRASLVPVCAAPERRPLNTADPARCPHERGK